MNQFFFNGFIQAIVGRPPSWSGWPNDWHFYDHFPKSPVTKLHLFIILSGIIPEIEDGNFKFKLEASKLYDIIICKVFYFPTLWSLNSAHWENIQKKKMKSSITDWNWLRQNVMILQRQKEHKLTNTFCSISTHLLSLFWILQTGNSL